MRVLMVMILPKVQYVRQSFVGVSLRPPFHIPNRGDPKAVVPAFQVEISMASAMASTPNPSVGEESLQADLDTAVGADARSLDRKACRILSKAVVATWEVHQLWEIIPTASWVPSYSEMPITQKRLRHI
jgi:hypothetical protein